MIIDGRQVPNGETIACDLCIIGAGAAGITLALQFAGSGVKVGLIESGGLDYDDATQDLYNGAVEGLPYAIDAETRLRYFGGSTNHWGGMSRPLDPLVFEPRPWIPHSGWPIRRADLDAYYPKAAELIEIAPLATEASVWAERLGRQPLPFDEGGGLFNAPFQASPPTRFGEAYRARLEAMDNLDIYLHANVVQLLPHGDGGQLDRVEIATLEGTGFEVRAKAYVLACGGIENARLLLASNRVEPAGLGNRRDLVGRFFMEHAHFDLGQVVLAEGAFDPALYVDYLTSEAGQTVAFHIAVDEAAQRKHEIAFASVQLRPNTPSAGEMSLRRLVGEVSQGKYPSDLGSHLHNVMADIGPVSSWIAGKVSHDLFGTARYGATLAIRSESEQVPHPDNRVTLGEDKDALGMPRVKLAFRLQELDLRTHLRSMSVMAETFGRLGLGRVQLAFDEATPPAYIQPGYHHVGTTRMADDPSEGVVDRDCRMHDLDNLYIAGSSVFPTSGDATPTLTIVAMTLRLAEHLRARVFA